jgi:hypothetical protein
MFAINKASAPFAWRIDFIPSRVKVPALMDSRVTSRKTTITVGPGRKEVALEHTTHLLDILEESGCSREVVSK